MPEPMTRAEEAFESWWKEAYEGSTLHDKETARTFWLAAWQVRGELDAEIAKGMCFCERENHAGSICPNGNTIATAIAQEDG